MWSDDEEGRRLAALRKNASVARKQLGRTEPFDAAVTLDLTIYTSQTDLFAISDLDKFVAGVSDGLQAADPASLASLHCIFEQDPEIHPEHPILFESDTQIVAITAKKKAVRSTDQPSYAVSVRPLPPSRWSRIAARLSNFIPWLNANIGFLTLVWVIVASTTAIYAWRAYRLSVAVALEPLLSFGDPVVSCKKTEDTVTELIRTIGPYVPKRYFVRSCGVRLRNSGAPATAVRLQVSIAEGSRFLLKRTGLYASLDEVDSSWGRPLSSLRWSWSSPPERTSPTEIQIELDRMLVGEVVTVRLDVAHDPAADISQSCKRALLLVATAKEVQTMGRAVVGSGDLCP